MSDNYLRRANNCMVRANSDSVSQAVCTHPLASTSSFHVTLLFLGDDITEDPPRGCGAGWRFPTRELPR